MKNEALHWQAYWADRTPENRNALVEHHFPLALMLARCWTQNNHSGLLDLCDFMAWATLGLINSVEAAKPDRGKFTRLARLAIEQRIIGGLGQFHGYGKAKKAWRNAIESGYATERDCDPTPDFHKSVDDADEINRLMEVVGSREREFLREMYWEGRSAAQIAEARGRTREHVSKLLSQARRRMRKRAASLV
jgi:RNA polymerase sigma factor (sigma-70 family)